MLTTQKPFEGERCWIKSNLKYAVIGVIVGLLISIMFGFFSPNGILLKNLLLNVLFSLFITLSIRNVIALVHIYFSLDHTSFWKFVLVFYVCNLIGMLIGIELSYLIVSFIFDVKYHFLSHVDDYKFTSMVTVVIGTLILLYHLQKATAETKLKAKEMDLARLNQLKTEAELQALQAKINPHFLYNALNSIISLIHDDPDKAEEMALKLAKLFRYSINSTQESFCTINEELEILNTYLAIEKVRFGSRINFQIVVADDLKEKLIPRFLLQPLVENALKHGLKDSRQDGELKVGITKEANQIAIIIHDNGSPFPDELIAGYGLQHTFEKLKLLYQEDYDLQINNTPEKHLKISIPLS